LDNLARPREAKLVREQRERFEKISARFDACVTLRRRLPEATHQPFELMAAVVKGLLARVLQEGKIGLSFWFSTLSQFLRSLRDNEKGNQVANPLR
jgi:hypothetical protein